MKYNVNFKALPTKAKIEYIWDYYRWHIFAIICGIAIIISSVLHAITYNEPLLSVIMLNSYRSMSDTIDSGFDEFFETYGYESFEGALELKKDLYFHGNGNTNQEDYQNYEIMLALLIGGDYEVFFGTGDAYLEFVEQGFFADLSEILSDDLLKKYGEQMIYSDDMGESAEYPAAIILKNNQWLAENNYYNGNCYIGILNQENTSEVVIEFIEFILSYNQPCR